MGTANTSELNETSLAESSQPLPEGQNNNLSGNEGLNLSPRRSETRSSMGEEHQDDDQMNSSSTELVNHVELNDASEIDPDDGIATSEANNSTVESEQLLDQREMTSNTTENTNALPSDNDRPDESIHENNNAVENVRETEHDNESVQNEIIDISILNENDQHTNIVDEENDDPHVERSGSARNRWIRINQRFQMLLTLVTVLFSLLLFCILVCWVVFTSSFVMSLNDTCDVPLRMYFWLSTMQLILDLFRADIMHYVLRWDSRSQRNVPFRVIVYNLCYVAYAMLVLRLGLTSVFLSPESQCRRTAPQLYQTATVFVSLTLGAWSVVLFGYVIPFICVIIILTRNGYVSTSDMVAWGNVFPNGSRGAPEGTIDLLKVISMDEAPEAECCICMEEFEPDDVIVMTDCKHIFHKSCCKEWLQQSTTCPVCRTDLTSPPSDPNNVENGDSLLVAAEEGIAIATGNGNTSINR